MQWRDYVCMIIGWYLNDIWMILVRQVEDPSETRKFVCRIKERMEGEFSLTKNYMRIDNQDFNLTHLTYFHTLMNFPCNQSSYTIVRIKGRGPNKKWHDLAWQDKTVTWHDPDMNWPWQKLTDRARCVSTLKIDTFAIIIVFLSSISCTQRGRCSTFLGLALDFSSASSSSSTSSAAAAVGRGAGGGRHTGLILQQQFWKLILANPKKRVFKTGSPKSSVKAKSGQSLGKGKGAEDDTKPQLLSGQSTSFNILYILHCDC